MLIGEIVRMTNLSRDTIRYYEKKGLLRVARGENKYNNYKNYTADSIERLEIIIWAKELGFSLKEIQEALSLWEDEALTVEDKKRIVTQKLASIEHKIEKLLKMKELLQKVYDEISPDCL